VDFAVDEVRFYTSADWDPIAETGTWDQQGLTRGLATVTTSMHDSTAAVLIGLDANNAGDWVGRIYYVEVRDSVDGTIVARYNASETTDAGSTFPNVVGETAWTNTGGALNGP
jgi:hypothetical protein